MLLVARKSVYFCLRQMISSICVNKTKVPVVVAMKARSQDEIIDAVRKPAKHILSLNLQ